MNIRIIRVGPRDHIFISYLPRMRISSPGTQNFPGNSLLKLFQQKKNYFLSFDGKRRHCGAGQNNIIPG